MEGISKLNFKIKLFFLYLQIFFCLLNGLFIISTEQMQNTKEIGNHGEDIACKYLERKEYKILKRNFHFGKIGEIDIVAEKDGTLVFVEVKTRKNNEYGDPLLSINHQKQTALRKAAEGYLYVNKINDKPCRFDIVIIDSASTPPKAKHLENAF